MPTALGFEHELWLLAVTVLMEAGWEPDIGKVAVAWTVCNRARGRKRSVFDTCLQPYQFSCWNTDSPTRSRLDTADEAAWFASYRAASAAYFAIGDDPAHGADHYLNEAVTRQMNNGQLPAWYREDAVTVRIGRHTFLRLG